MSSSFRRAFALILVLAFCLRLGAALYLGERVSGLSGAWDEISYDKLGWRWATGHGLTYEQDWYPWIRADAPQSYYSASMSLSLGMLYALIGHQPLAARLLMALLSTATVALLMLLCRRLFGAQVALLAGLIAACYAYLIFYGVSLLTETPFMLCLVAALYLSYRTIEKPSARLWLLLGATLAVTILFRMAVVFFVPCLLVLIALKQPLGRRMLAIPVIMMILAVSPFTLQNYRTWGRFLLLEAQFGHVFWNGNHPDQRGNFHPFVVFPIPPAVLESRNDAEITNRLLALGIENVLGNPGDFVRLTITRLREFFVFWPTPDSTPLANALRVLSFGIMLPFALLGLGLSLPRWREFLPLYLFMLVHTGIYAVSWTMVRYRIPLDLILIPFGAFGVNALVSAARARRAVRASPAGEPP